MKDYFILQYHLLGRKLKEAGIHPWLAHVLLAIAFTGFSWYLFYKTEYAVYIYAALALVLAGKLSEPRRNDFLLICYGNNRYRHLRMLENFIAVLPFIIFLLYQHAWWFAISLALLSTLMALVNFRASVDIRIPTPFYKKPFEFATGFRNSWYVILPAYALTVVAVMVPNFNLGVFAMLVVFGVTLTYYLKPEHPYYVWIFGMTARAFLLEKIKTATGYASLLAFPIALALSIFFPQHIAIVLAFFLLGLANLVCIIVSKYAAYPDELNLSQSIILALCIWLPPLLIIMIPFLFRKSQQRLSQLLP